MPDGENPLYWSTIGVFGEAGSDNDHFYVPNHIDIDGDDNLYVADSENHRIQKCTYSGSWSCTTFHGGEEGDGDDQLSIPNAATVNGSTLNIADTGNWRVKSCDLNTMECNSDFIIDIDTPTDVAVNTLGEIFVSQTGSAHIVSRFSSEGTKLDDYAGTYGTPYLTSPDKIFWPNGLAVDRPPSTDRCLVTHLVDTPTNASIDSGAVAERRSHDEENRSRRRGNDGKRNRAHGGHERFPRHARREGPGVPRPWHDDESRSTCSAASTRER